MPRYSTKSLLVATAVIALWLSTFAGYPGSLDVRKSILLCIFVASGFAAVYNRGKRRAFWAGFFTVMLMCGGMSLQQPLHRYNPDFIFQSANLPFGISQAVVAQPQMVGGYAPTPPTVWSYASPVAAFQPTMEATITATITAAWTLALSLLVGYIAAYIYDQSQQDKDG